MPETGAQERTADRGRGVGKFNLGGRAADGGDVEFYQRGDKIFVRRRGQTTRDRNQMRADGQDPSSTTRDEIQHETKLTVKAEAKGERKLIGTESPERLAEGRLGAVDGEYTALGVEGTASAEGSLSKDGLEVKAGVGGKATLIGGKLVYQTPELAFTLGGQQMALLGGAEVSAEVAAEAKGELGITAKKEGSKVKIGTSAGAEAFAGAKAGFKIFGKLTWNDPSTRQKEDVAAAFVGVEGWAGAAAAAKVECSLAPSIKANAYWGAAVGVGAAVKAGIEINAIKAARLSYLLAAAGIKAAWEGLEYMAGKVGEWLDAGAAEVVAAAGYFVDAVSDWLGSDDKAREAVAKKLHQHMDHRGRARLIDTLMSGACFNEDEDAILTIMRFAKSRNDLWLMMGRVDGGYDAILSALDGEQDTRARVIMGLS